MHFTQPPGPRMGTKTTKASTSRSANLRGRRRLRWRSVSSGEFVFCLAQNIELEPGQVLIRVMARAGTRGVRGEEARTSPPYHLDWESRSSPWVNSMEAPNCVCRLVRLL